MGARQLRRETGAWSREGGAYQGPVALPNATGDQYGDRLSGEPARLHAETPHAGLSQRQMGDCSRSVHE